MRIKPIRKNRIFCLLAGLPLPSLLPKIAQCAPVLPGTSINAHYITVRALHFIDHCTVHEVFIFRCKLTTEIKKGIYQEHRWMNKYYYKK